MLRIYHRPLSRTLVGNEIVDNSDVVGAAPTGNLTHGFNGLSEDNCKRIEDTFKFGVLVRLILEVLRWGHHNQQIPCKFANRT